MSPAASLSPHPIFQPAGLTMTWAHSACAHDGLVSNVTNDGSAAGAARSAEHVGNASIGSGTTGAAASVAPVMATYRAYAKRAMPPSSLTPSQAHLANLTLLTPSQAHLVNLTLLTPSLAHLVNLTLSHVTRGTLPTATCLLPTSAPFVPIRPKFVSIRVQRPSPQPKTTALTKPARRDYNAASLPRHWLGHLAVSALISAHSTSLPRWPAL